MKIDIKQPDSISQLTDLLTLLNTEQPTKEDLALALVVITRVFFENRPGRFANDDTCSISGTGCHNPVSYKNGEPVKFVWRLELSIGSKRDFLMVLSYENKQDGFLTADLYFEGFHWIVTADVHFKEELSELVPRSIIIVGGYADVLMELLRKWISPLLEKLINIQGGVVPIFSNLQSINTSKLKGITSSPVEKKFIQQVVNRLPKQSYRYFYPEAKPEDVELREKIFEEISKVANGTRRNPNETVQKILDPLMVLLESRVPLHLKERFLKKFSFERAFSGDKRHNIRKLYVDRMHALIGILLLRDLDFSFDELVELNHAWYPFVGFHPQYHSFSVYAPEKVAKAHQEKIDDFFEIARKVQSGEQ